MIDMAFLRRRAAVDYLEVSQLRGWKEDAQDKIAEIGEESVNDGEQSVLYSQAPSPFRNFLLLCQLVDFFLSIYGRNKFQSKSQLLQVCLRKQ